MLARGAGKSIGASVSRGTGLAFQTRHVETFVHSRLTIQTGGTWARCVTSGSDSPQSTANLVSGLAAESTCTAVAGRTGLPLQTRDVEAFVHTRLTVQARSTRSGSMAGLTGRSWSPAHLSAGFAVQTGRTAKTKAAGLVDQTRHVETLLHKGVTIQTLPEVSGASGQAMARGAPG